MKFKRELDIPHTKPSGPFVDADFDHSTPDHAVPTPEDHRLALGMMAGKVASTLTLRAAAQKAPRAVGAPDVLVTVDDAVAEKPVSVFGSSYVSSPLYLKALSTVYGLELLQREKGGYAIWLPRVRQLRDYQDPREQLRKLIPEAVLRSFHG